MCKCLGGSEKNYREYSEELTKLMMLTQQLEDEIKDGLEIERELSSIFR